MTRTKIIGLTGQSGAGKSTALKVFEEKGFAVFNSDLAVKNIYESGSICLSAVAAQFGQDIIRSDGSLNRALLSQRAFAAKENTQTLNAIVHPFVTAELLKQIKSEKPKLLVCDAPQLFESNIDVLCDCIVCVVADKEVRTQRICKRDNISEQEALIRISAQYDENFFRSHSDFTLENNGDLHSFIRKAENLIDEIYLKCNAMR